jgi:hypothetical protein
VIAYLFNVPVRFRARQTIKKLSARLGSCDREISELKREIQGLQGAQGHAEDQSTTSLAQMPQLNEEAGARFSENTDEKRAANPFDHTEEPSSDKNLSS